MKRVLVGLLLALIIGLCYCMWPRDETSVVGVWKGTDEFGHEHYFEFRTGGTLMWWDRDRSPDGSFTDRPHFMGVYKLDAVKKIVARTGGIPSQPLGTLTMTSQNELMQDGGDSLRNNLVYRRVAL